MILFKIDIATNEPNGKQGLSFFYTGKVLIIANVVPISLGNHN